MQPHNTPSPPTSLSIVPYAKKLAPTPLLCLFRGEKAPNPFDPPPNGALILRTAAAAKGRAGSPSSSSNKVVPAPRNFRFFFLSPSVAFPSACASTLLEAVSLLAAGWDLAA